MSIYSDGSVSVCTDLGSRWLIDNSRDEAGMRVIADLHGGDLNDLKAQAEFQEIKDKVVQEV